MKSILVRVEAVCLSIPRIRVAKAPQEEAFIGPHGLVGDRHEGEFRRGRNGGVYPNQRQWSAVSVEEVRGLCADMGVEAFQPGELGENLLLSGVRLAEVPEGSVLEFPSGARLHVAGQNDPCVNAAAELSQTYRAVVREYFVKTAWGRRGLVGSVLESGLVRPGDDVTILVPDLASTT
jgi:MOSC domain-containing protein YiiM